MDRHGGERIGTLEHHADARAKFGQRDVAAVDIRAFEKDLASHLGRGGAVVEAIERTQQGGLARTRRTDEAGDAVLGDVEGGVTHGRAVVEGDGDVAQAHRDLGGRQHRRGDWRGRRHEVGLSGRVLQHVSLHHFRRGRGASQSPTSPYAKSLGTGSVTVRGKSDNRASTVRTPDELLVTLLTRRSSRHFREISAILNSVQVRSRSKVELS